MKTKVYLILSILFLILTLIGISYVSLNNENARGLYISLPLLFAVVFTAAYRNSKKK